MATAGISREMLIAAGAGLLIFLFLLSRCSGDPERSELIAQTPLQNDIAEETDQIERTLEAQLPDTERLAPQSLDPKTMTREDFVDIWKAASVPYDPSCAAGCEELAVIDGQAHGDTGGRLLFDPQVDDPVAQWGDCVMSISLCFDVEAQDTMSQRAMDDVLIACVAKSQCPARCRDAFRAKTTIPMPGTVFAALESVIVGEQALCLPREAWVQ